MPASALLLVDTGLRGMVVALALLLAALVALELWRRPRPWPPAALAALFMGLGLAVQVPGSAPWLENSANCAVLTPLIGISVGNAVLFWLFTAALFDDEFRWRAWHAAAWGGAVLVGALQCPLAVGLGPGPVLLAARVVLRAIPLLCAAAVLLAALRHWRADLVERRRLLRGWLVAGGLVYTLVQLAARLTTERGVMTPALGLLDVAMVLAVLGAWALAVLRVGPEALVLAAPPVAAEPASPPAPAPEPPPGPAAEPDAADQALAAALEQAMHEDRAYRADDLSLAALAEKLAVPEYRLRRHINQRLGFRNFNAYVNSFRLADARRWLADPAQAETPVLTLALDAGFGSIGPFNRAFKADTGLTPTEFRARALAESRKA